MGEYPRSAVAFTVCWGRFGCFPLLVLSGLYPIAIMLLPLNLLLLQEFRPHFLPFLAVEALILLAPSILLSLWVASLMRTRAGARLGLRMAASDPCGGYSGVIYGSALVSRLRGLDALAEEEGVTPLYEMGIREEGVFAWQRREFDPSDGIRTIDAILARFDREGASEPELRSDLCELRRELVQARDAGESVRLAFL